MSDYLQLIEPLEPRRLLSAGDLDPAFGSAGVVVYPDIATPPVGIATQSDGKYVVATHDAVYRFRADGSLDKTFGTRGRVTPGFTLYGVGIDHHGKIAVGGGTKDFKWAAARYNTDGSPDTTFNGTGRIVTHVGNTNDEHASVMALQPDGKILVGGVQFNGNTDDNINFDYNAVAVRFRTDGTVDTSFGTGGEAFDTPLFNAVNAIALAPNGDVALAGRSDAGQSFHDQWFEVVNSAGRPVDGTPAEYEDGSVFSSFRAAAYRPDGTRVLADEDEGNSTVMLGSKPVGIVFDPLGSTASGWPFYLDEKINAIVTTSDNKTLVAGDGIVRLNVDGTPDNTFGFGGFTRLDVNRRKPNWIDRIISLADGDLLAAGTVGGRLFVARIQGGGHAVGSLAPRARADANPPAPNAPQLEFNVAYAAEESIDAASLGDRDVRVTGPNGYSVLAHLTSVVDRYNGRQRVATYTIDAPGGGWNRADNGQYTIYLRGGQVVDNRGHAAPAGTIGTVTVYFPSHRRRHATAQASTTLVSVFAPAAPELHSSSKRDDLFDDA
jgi:uncharacterized delta-60 repeat protein